MGLADLTPDAVLKAIAEFDDVGRDAFLHRYGFGRAIRYFLQHDGRRYDSKAIAGVAHRFARPDEGPLTADTFSGGEKNVAAKLGQLGFVVGGGDWDYIPEPADYVRFLSHGRVTSFERAILLALYAAPEQEARNAVLAEAVASKMFVVNGALGRLGRKAIEFLKIRLPDKAMPSHAIAWFDDRDGYWYSVMHDAVREAIVRLGWADEARQQFGGFWEAEAGNTEAATYWEGREREHQLVRRARNGRAREECITHYGPRCLVCNFDFAAVYGERGLEFIEVHHLALIAAQSGEYSIDPIKDLRPVCANCHRMLHRDGLIPIEELKAIVEAQRKAL